MTIFGWDASNFDHGRGPMDMAAARRDGIDFYTHKATEGTNVKHTPGPSLAAARDAGIPFLGCYMVPRTPGSSITAQVDYFLSWVDSQAPWWRTFPGWFFQMDTEHWGYDNVAASVGHQAALQLGRRTGKAVLHYAPKWAYENSVPEGIPLWGSSYVGGAGHYRALYPGDSSSRWAAYSGRQPSILQYTSSATIGRQPTCDANAFRGTVADFARLIGATSEGVDDMNVDQDQKLTNVHEWLKNYFQGNVTGTWPHSTGVLPKLVPNETANALALKVEALTAAFTVLANAINDAGGSVDTAEILAGVDVRLAALAAEQRDAVADLGEGGAAQVRADA